MTTEALENNFCLLFIISICISFHCFPQLFGWCNHHRLRHELRHHGKPDIQSSKIIHPSLYKMFLASIDFIFVRD